MHESSLMLVGRFARLVERLWAGQPCRVLDVGSADINGSYRELFAFAGADYVGADLAPGSNVDVVLSDPYDWPELEDASFDAVICGQTLEHAEYPWRLMASIASKLKPGGLAMIVAPSRGPEHRYPRDCYRFLPDGLRALGRWAGLAAVEVGHLAGGGAFADGSSQWGDCYGVFSRPKQSCKPCWVGAESRERAGSATAMGRRPDGYFEFDRREIDQLLRRLDLPVRRVLEIGCASGRVGGRLREFLQVADYVGIEVDPLAAALAAEKLHRVVCADVERCSLDALGVEPGSVDLLIALDVLEHLRDPWTTLRRAVTRLRFGGHVLLSLPNVQNAWTIRELLEGRWRYTEAGLLDWGHLRFFGWEGVRQMLKSCGLEQVAVGTVEGPLAKPRVITDEGNAIRVGRAALLDLTAAEVSMLFTYQYLVLARLGHDASCSEDAAT
ncbi:MAG TPA: methyltransferase domain-containing protein [Thermoanaerobaculaceae bacterium]|nr:methyltransferase domain-containing protein [Thermoanaerobaculaceae bacterium]HRS17113.1 methyltransferase domain-containing protein [Thermoanaerobaculaceae bacterium]